MFFHKTDSVIEKINENLSVDESLQRIENDLVQKIRRIQTLTLSKLEARSNQENAKENLGKLKKWAKLWSKFDRNCKNDQKFKPIDAKDEPQKCTNTSF